MANEKAREQAITRIVDAVLDVKRLEKELAEAHERLAKANKQLNGLKALEAREA